MKSILMTLVLGIFIAQPVLKADSLDLLPLDTAGLSAITSIIPDSTYTYAGRTFDPIEQALYQPAIAVGTLSRSDILA